MLSFEVLLPLGALAFYLYDATLWLYGNELALEKSARGWSGEIGSLVQAGGRRPFVPNVLAPGRLLFRAVWDREGRWPDGALDIDSLVNQLRPLRIIVTVQAFMLFFALPPISILLGAGPLLLALFAGYYGLTLVSLGLLVIKRRALRTSPKQVAWLAIEALLCAPFAINLVRKLSLARSSEIDWLKLAREHLSPQAKTDLLRDLDGRLNEFLACEDPGSPNAIRFEALRTSLKEHLDVPLVA